MNDRTNLGQTAALPDGVGDQIEQVLVILKDIRDSVTDQLGTEESLYQKKGSWCDEKLKSLNSTKAQVEQNLEITIARLQDLETKTEVNADKLRERSAAIDETANTIDAKEATYKDTSEEFEQKIQLLREHISKIESSEKLLGKAGASFLSRMESDGAIAAISAVSDTTGVRISSKLPMTGDSRIISGVLGEIKNDMLNTLRSTLESYDQQKRSHDNFIASSKAELKILRSRKAADLLEETDAKMELVKERYNLKDLKTELKDIVKLLRRFTDERDANEANWKIIGKQMSEEKRSLEKVIDLMRQAKTDPGGGDSKDPGSNSETEGAASFLQKSARNFARREKKRGMKFLGQFRERNLRAGDAVVPDAADGLADVQDTLSKVLDVQLQTRKELKEKAQRCKAELEAVAMEVKKISMKLGSTKANVILETIEIEKAKSLVDALIANINSQNLAVSEEQALIKQSRDMYTRQKKDNTVAREILEKAKGVAQDLAQKSSVSDISFKGVVSMIEKIIDDLQHEQATVNKALNELEAKSVSLVQELRETGDEFQKQKTQESMETSRRKVRLNAYKEDEAEEADTHKAVTKRESILKDECADVSSSLLSDKLKEIDFKISQFRDAKDVVAGSSDAVRTGGTSLRQEESQRQPAVVISEDEVGEN